MAVSIAQDRINELERTVESGNEAFNTVRANWRRDLATATARAQAAEGRLQRYEAVVQAARDVNDATDGVLLTATLCALDAAFDALDAAGKEGTR